MRAGIIQSNYLPWRGYLDFIDDCDVFIFYDDVQFSKGSWRNRNRIKTPRDVQWLTVPVLYRFGQSIGDTRIDNGQAWVRRHIDLITASYSSAPYFRPFADQLFEILAVRHETISELNVELLRWLVQLLGIQTRLVLSSELGATGSKTERLISLLNEVRADVYLSGPAAQVYLDENMLRAAGIQLEYKCYDYLEYPQLWGDFVGDVSVIDLLFSVGPGAREYLKSRHPNVAAA